MCLRDPILTTRYIPNLIRGVPNLTGYSNVPKIEEFWIWIVCDYTSRLLLAARGGHFLFIYLFADSSIVIFSVNPSLKISSAMYFFL